jgi:hypothetical protein
MMTWITSIFANLIDKYIMRGFRALQDWWRVRAEKKENRAQTQANLDKALSAKELVIAIQNEMSLLEAGQVVPEEMQQRYRDAQEKLRDANKRSSRG